MNFTLILSYFLAVHMSEVLPNLFVGSIDDLAKWSKPGLTHVLTSMMCHFAYLYVGFMWLMRATQVMPGELDVPLPDTVRRQMSIPLLDEANADLLHALPVCIEFIDDALLNDGKVLVHWCAGGCDFFFFFFYFYLLLLRFVPPTTTYPNFAYPLCLGCKVWPVFRAVQL